MTMIGGEWGDQYTYVEVTENRVCRHGFPEEFKVLYFAYFIII